jgi:hypothetical protein
LFRFAAVVSFDRPRRAASKKRDFIPFSTVRRSPLQKKRDDRRDRSDAQKPRFFSILTSQKNSRAARAVSTFNVERRASQATRRRRNRPISDKRSQASFFPTRRREIFKKEKAQNASLFVSARTYNNALPNVERNGKTVKGQNRK